ncbi:MAG: hypothetical protein ATN35_06730 [Epulopiscium sp. Nele67-Bin004]|nr:MAG: hypothetical protein ATN35_06730 [Epulopiscium sp. Nele67-Bin004]
MLLVNQLSNIIREIQSCLLFLSNNTDDCKLKTYFLFVSHQIPESIYIDIDNKFCCNWECDVHIYPVDRCIKIGGKEVFFEVVVHKCIDHVLIKYNNPTEDADIPEDKFYSPDKTISFDEKTLSPK